MPGSGRYAEFQFPAPGYDRLVETKARRMTTILIVEDDDPVRVLTESILRDAGYKVIAATAVDGSGALLETDQSIDLLFVDLILGQDLEAGLKVAQKARERRPGISVLYTSGLRINDGMKALFEEPFLFLPKPYTAEQLVKTIEYLLLKSTPHERLKFPESDHPEALGQKEDQEPPASGDEPGDGSQ
jgi:DNA-binding NtrC family response regulator